MQQRQMQAHVGTSLLYHLQSRDRLQLKWPFSYSRTWWFHEIAPLMRAYGCTLAFSSVATPCQMVRGQHDSVDFKPLSRAESCLGPEKSAANPEGVGLRFLVPMHHHVAFDAVDSTLEEGHGMAFGFGPATL